MTYRNTETAETRSVSIQELPVSVVIATLGGPTLMATIEALNSPHVRPAEILVCVPDDAWDNRPQFISPNTRVIVLPFRGQVRQRAAGFKEALQPFVLQLDDDLDFPVVELVGLMSELKKCGTQSSIGPMLTDMNGHPFSPLPTGVKGLLAFGFGTVAHGVRWGSGRMGAIARTGRAYGVDSAKIEDSRLRVDWLPGGCVLHYRQNLILEDFFSLPGKAYGEDVMHSALLRQKGVTLYVTSRAHCGVAPALSAVSFAERVEHIKAMRLVGRAIGVPFTWRLWGLFLTGAVAVVSHIVLFTLRPLGKFRCGQNP